MSNLSRIVKVTISRQTKSVSAKGFGIGLVLGEEAEKPAGMNTRTRSYFDMEGVAADFNSSDEIYKACQAYFGQAIKPEKVIIGFIEGVETVADALDAISDENDEWYAVGMIDDTQANQEALATYISTKNKIAGIRSADADVVGSGSTDIASVLKASANERAFVIYSKNADTQYPEFAWLGLMLPKAVGSATWKFKTLVGITQDNLTASEITNLQDKNCNFYHTFGGVGITEEGYMPSGEFIDVMRSVDFIQARMQENIYGKLVNVDKIPFTNAGIDIVSNLMYEILNQSVSQGILSNEPYPVIERPDVRDIPTADRTARKLVNMKFFAVLQGAVHKVEIEGTVTV